MNVKRFIGDNSQEVMQKVKKSFGENAVILHTRPIRRKGWRGFFQKPLIEVVAAMDEARLETSAAMEPKGADLKVVKPTAGEGKKLYSLEKKIDAMHEIMNRFLTEIKYAGNGYREYDGEYQSIFDTLVTNGVYPEYAHRILREIREASNESNQEPWTMAEEILRNHLPVAAASANDKKQRKVILFLGPTGVGKTTTLAKLAAKYTFEDGMRVGLITEDTYRIAAVEQLKTYAEIMRLPLSVIYSAQEAADALKEHEDRDIVLIDTAGRSPRDPSNEERIMDLIRLSGADEVYLVISATTDYTGCVNITEGYRFLKDCRLIFTKLDETTAYGSILNTAMMTEKPVVYVTTGQNVPNDIETFSQRKIVNQLIGRVAYE